MMLCLWKETVPGLSYMKCLAVEMTGQGFQPVLPFGLSGVETAGEGGRVLTHLSEPCPLQPCETPGSQSSWPQLPGHSFTDPSAPLPVVLGLEHTFTCVCMHVFMCAYVCVHVFSYVHGCTCLCVHVNACMHVRVHAVCLCVFGVYTNAQMQPGLWERELSFSCLLPEPCSRAVSSAPETNSSCDCCAAVCRHSNRHRTGCIRTLSGGDKVAPGAHLTLYFVSNNFINLFGQTSNGN